MHDMDAEIRSRSAAAPPEEPTSHFESMMCGSDAALSGRW